MRKKKTKSNAAANEARQRIITAINGVKANLVQRDEVVDLLAVSAVAGYPLLLAGPPGTGKSMAITMFRDAIGVSDDDYFELLLTKFTEPGEVLGPVDIMNLKQGRMIRRMQGMLPTAKMVFLDEVFKGNSAILNALLGAINDHRVYEEGRAIDIPLEVLVGATNDIPQTSELSALRDRFALKMVVRPLRIEHFDALLNAGAEIARHKAAGRKPWAATACSLDDVLTVREYLVSTSGENDPLFGKDEFREFKRLVSTIRHDLNIFISDRRLGQMYSMIRAYAWLLRGDVVTRNDLELLKYCGDSLDSLDQLATEVPRHLRGSTK
jgi:MoxR-like ATPase